MIIIGEAQAATLLGDAISRNPGYLKLRKLRASGTIAKTVSIILNEMTLLDMIRHYLKCLTYQILNINVINMIHDFIQEKRP